jgi:hypothetical protein
VPPILQAHQIRVASWSGQVPGASPTNLVYNNPCEAQADPVVGRQESEISAVGLSAQRGSTSVHVLMHRFLCLIIAPSSHRLPRRRRSTRWGGATPAWSDVGTAGELLSVAPCLLIRKVIFHVGWDRCARHLMQHDCLQEPQHEKLVYANATRLRRLIVIDGDLRFRLCVRPQATRRPHLTCISCILNIRRSATKDRILHLRSPRLFRGKRDVVVA